MGKYSFFHANSDKAQDHGMPSQRESSQTPAHQLSFIEQQMVDLIENDQLEEIPTPPYPGFGDQEYKEAAVQKQF